MLLRGTSLFATLAATAALAVGTPAAGASTWPIDYSSLAPVALPVPGNAAGPCGTISNEGQGRASGNEASVCSVIGGLTFIGPSVGQVATVIGPTIMTPGFVGTIVQANGNVAVGP